MNISPAPFGPAVTQSYAVNLPPPPVVTQKVETKPKQSNALAETGGPTSSPNPEPTSYSLANSSGISGTSGRTVNLTA